MRRLGTSDQCVAAFDRALAAVFGTPSARRPRPRPPAAASGAGAALDPSQRRLSGALMRVNHVGEVCAQALYEGQAATARDPQLRRYFREAAQEEADHLAWTRERLDELSDSPSLLNPLWYAGAFALGALAGRAGDRFSLGFMIETERQVEEHLAGHLDRLPASDAASRAIVEQMKRDEAAHAQAARSLGGSEIAAPLKAAMRAAARVMTVTAHRL
ncbi:MAG TPA: 2-polyprenyl-3-methyl-6-methoxy-1,4-benzoquinone monooxygenase [Burkholderiaceae bacterium]|nr:2-polyprenyl-3-methyl-6-methoxy-1,4-benzoquinone monooxygenase [Burkholderiaceae bacterium]